MDVSELDRRKFLITFCTILIPSIQISLYICTYFVSYVELFTQSYIMNIIHPQINSLVTDLNCLTKKLDDRTIIQGKNKSNLRIR